MKYTNTFVFDVFEKCKKHLSYGETSTLFLERDDDATNIWYGKGTVGFLAQIKTLDITAPEQNMYGYSIQRAEENSYALSGVKTTINHFFSLEAKPFDFSQETLQYCSPFFYALLKEILKTDKNAEKNMTVQSIYTSNTTVLIFSIPVKGDMFYIFSALAKDKVNTLLEKEKTGESRTAYSDANKKDLLCNLKKYACAISTFSLNIFFRKKETKNEYIKALSSLIIRLETPSTLIQSQHEDFFKQKEVLYDGKEKEEDVYLCKIFPEAINYLENPLPIKVQNLSDEIGNALTDLATFLKRLFKLNGVTEKNITLIEKNDKVIRLTIKVKEDTYTVVSPLKNKKGGNQ